MIWNFCFRMRPGGLRFLRADRLSSSSSDPKRRLGIGGIGAIAGAPTETFGGDPLGVIRLGLGVRRADDAELTVLSFEDKCGWV